MRLARQLTFFVVVVLAHFFAAAPSALAQHGDKAGEAQPALPDHIDVPPSPMLSAEEALTTFRVAPGFRVEVVAAEPLVHDPVAITYGPDGRLWVVEMIGYMPDADGTGEDAKVGSIAVLEDTDGDGRMDKRTVFLDGLVLPRALALAGDGVLVAEPPHLWFCRDTNGDDVSDEKTEIDSNYGGTTNPEHTANGLMRALDNWIYNANHTVRFLHEGGATFRSELTATHGQWGITQDDVGRIFFNDNSDPLRADLVPPAYFARNRFLANPAGVNVRVAPQKLSIWPARVTTGVNRGYRSLGADGKITTVTAACGPLIYRGAMYPAEFAGNAFICEPSGNFVKRIVLSERDGMVEGRNAYEGAEFLSSTDERFRPVNLANGPDGALHIVDMYRGIIQHRIYMTTFLRKQVEERGLAAGIGFGRIYRIVPDRGGAKVTTTKTNLASETSVALVAHLRDANGWSRDTAQRLLVERRDPEALPALRELIASAPDPLARVHALWTLDGAGTLDRDTVLGALGDADARVCAAAIRLSERFLAPPGDKEVFRRVVALAARTDAAVRLQLAFSLGEAGTPAGDAALRTLALATDAQPFVADAIVSGLAGREDAFITALAREAKPGVRAPTAVVILAASAVFKSGDAPRIASLLDAIGPDAHAPAWMRAAVLDGVELFLPKTPEKKLVAGTLPVEPRGLLALAVRGDAQTRKRAAELVALLKWPGKPGLEREAAEIAARLTLEQKSLFEKGRATYAGICAACHQPNGEGLNGLAPPLLYSRHVLGSERALARIVLNGKEKEGRIMPGLRGLDDETLAGALTYVRQSWGHNAPPVSPAAVARARLEVGAREEPWTDEELQSLSD